MEKTKITVSYRTCDRYGESRSFATLAGARSYAIRKIGPHPEIGTSYAVSPCGTAVIRVKGTTLESLFPPVCRVYA